MHVRVFVCVLSGKVLWAPMHASPHSSGNSLI